jgi:hypothetical protein
MFVVMVVRKIERQFRKIFSQHLVTENDLECRSEVDQYLLDGCEADIIDFDILTWWKVNAPKYPTPAEIARDVLTIPIFTIASEPASNIEGSVLDLMWSFVYQNISIIIITTRNRTNPCRIRL